VSRSDASGPIASIAAAFISAFTKRNAEPMLVIPSVLYCLELFSLVDMEGHVKAKSSESKSSSAR